MNITYVCMYIISSILKIHQLYTYMCLILLPFGESSQTLVAALLGGEPIRHVFAFLDEEPLF